MKTKVIQQNTYEIECRTCNGTKHTWQSVYHNQTELKPCQTCQATGIETVTTEHEITNYFKKIDRYYSDAKNRKEYKKPKSTTGKMTAAEIYATGCNIKNEHEYNLVIQAYEAGQKNEIKAIHKTCICGEPITPFQSYCKKCEVFKTY